MKEYALIGYPLTHSFSQKYFLEKFEAEKITDSIFLTFSISHIEDLKNVLAQHPLLKGFAVTIPHKRSVLQFVDKISETVARTNACNCVKIEDEKLLGFNTDVIGFEMSFKKHLKPHHNKALILGTGGAASAVKFVLDKLLIDSRFVSRFEDQENNILEYKKLNDELFSTYNIIINCTPCGTYPNVNEAPDIPYHLLTAQHYLFDLIYNPVKTQFLLLGEERQATIQNGYEMLVLQAEENWKIWNS
jgi:shikimate dehydrogenase